jgi:NAD(P)-dependent dehydrogenase (short-subunit alcohol dehydrogenase family)
MSGETRFRLDGRLVLITGASSGIGAACARLAAELGARVALSARRESELAAICAGLPGSGHSVHRADLADPDSCEPLVRELVAQQGPLGGIIHACGETLDKPLRITAAADFQRLYATNTISAAMLAQAAVRHGRLVAGQAGLVVIGSITARRGHPALAAYAAAKAALEGLIVTTAIELARLRLRVNGLIVGAVDTPMLQATAAKLGPAYLERTTAAHPLGLGQPEDVAHAAAFLLSDAARWITGACLSVDGGFLAR